MFEKTKKMVGMARFLKMLCNGSTRLDLNPLMLEANGATTTPS